MKITTITAVLAMGVMLLAPQLLPAQQETAETAGPTETTQPAGETPHDTSVAVRREEPDIATLEKQSQEEQY